MGGREEREGGREGKRLTAEYLGYSIHTKAPYVQSITFLESGHVITR